IDYVGYRVSREGISPDPSKAKEISAISTPTNFTKPFIVQADGSSHGLGAALCQVDDNGVERPIKFASRALSSAEIDILPPVLPRVMAVMAMIGRIVQCVIEEAKGGGFQIIQNLPQGGDDSLYKLDPIDGALLMVAPYPDAWDIPEDVEKL
ncbi:hypothetical protein Pmar_PMAR010100, partial [Perkinsus marinus ATCC 50983]